MSTALRLRPPRLQDEAAGRRAHQALEDHTFFLDYDPHEAWTGIVGRSSIRFELNEYLASAGGHIGYAVLPAHRRRGHATEILRQSLVVARAHGVDDVLVTCAVDNLGSRTVIERCGGEYESDVHDPKEDVEKRRYWIR